MGEEWVKETEGDNYLFSLPFRVGSYADVEDDQGGDDTTADPVHGSERNCHRGDCAVSKSSRSGDLMG